MMVLLMALIGLTAIISVAVGWLLGEASGYKAGRAVVMARLESEENSKNYIIYCEQTKWRLKLTDTIEVIDG